MILIFKNSSNKTGSRTRILQPEEPNKSRWSKFIKNTLTDFFRITLSARYIMAGMLILLLAVPFTLQWIGEAEDRQKILERIGYAILIGSAISGTGLSIQLAQFSLEGKTKHWVNGSGAALQLLGFWIGYVPLVLEIVRDDQLQSSRLQTLRIAFVVIAAIILIILLILLIIRLYSKSELAANEKTKLSAPKDKQLKGSTNRSFTASLTLLVFLAVSTRSQMNYKNRQSQSKDNHDSTTEN